MGCIQSNPKDLHGKGHQPKVVVAGPAPEASDQISNKVALGAGCFWGVQKFVEKGEAVSSKSVWFSENSTSTIPNHGDLTFSFFLIVL